MGGESRDEDKVKLFSFSDLESPTLGLRDDGEPAVFLGSVGVLPEAAEQIANGILAKAREYLGEEERG